MTDFEAVDEDVLDAIAEVANMIVGNVKTTLENTLGAMGLSAPAVFFGGDFVTRVAGNPDTVRVPFTCAEGSLMVQIFVAPVDFREIEAQIDQLVFLMSCIHYGADPRSTDAPVKGAALDDADSLAKGAAVQ